jgi:hypothetical protein
VRNRLNSKVVKRFEDTVWGLKTMLFKVYWNILTLILKFARLKRVPNNEKA